MPRNQFLSNALLVLVALCAPLSATTIVPASDADLVDRAAGIVTATVVATHPGDGGSVSTLVELRVERSFKGAPTEGETLTIRLPGGISESGLVRKLWGIPTLQAGDRTLLFLDGERQGSRRSESQTRRSSTPLVDPVLGVMQIALREEGWREIEIARRDLVGVVDLTTHAPVLEPDRDLAGFTRWISDRVAGIRREADYLVAARRVAAEPHQAFEPFSLINDVGCGDGRPIRWFQFDSGGSVTLRAHSSGQPGLAGGGFGEFQTALATWTADPATPIKYLYGGTTGSTADCSNSILFEDPNDEITGSFGGSGTVALGGPCYFCPLQSFQGQTYHATASVSITTQDGINLLFAGPGGSTTAQELFAHELGHTLGLGHTNISSALMFPSLRTPSIGATLGSDDRAGILALYGQPTSGGQSPSAPANLIASAIDSSTIRLTWLDTSNVEKQMRVEIDSTDDGVDNFQQIASLPANTTQYDVESLAEASRHRFRVRANNDFGNSTYSNIARGITLTASAIAPPDGPWLTTSQLPGFRFKVRITAGDTERDGTSVADCVPDTLCVAGALPGRTEAFLRVIGPRPNGKLWPQVIRFTVSRVEAWFEQLSTSEQRFYLLEATGQDSDLLEGLSDREGFEP